jgi:hypothetical protein
MRGAKDSKVSLSDRTFGLSTFAAFTKPLLLKSWEARIFAKAVRSFPSCFVHQARGQCSEMRAVVRIVSADSAFMSAFVRLLCFND